MYPSRARNRSVVRCRPGDTGRSPCCTPPPYRLGEPAAQEVLFRTHLLLACSWPAPAPSVLQRVGELLQACSVRDSRGLRPSAAAPAPRLRSAPGYCSCQGGPAPAPEPALAEAPAGAPGGLLRGGLGACRGGHPAPALLALLLIPGSCPDPGPRLRSCSCCRRRAAPASLLRPRGEDGNRGARSARRLSLRRRVPHRPSRRQRPMKRSLNRRATGVAPRSRASLGRATVCSY